MPDQTRQIYHGISCSLNALFGLGLRAEHYHHFLSPAIEILKQVDWLEAITENYLFNSGRPREHLSRIRENFPIALHGVGMSIGDEESISADYIGKLKTLVDEIEPWQVSEHLCLSKSSDGYSHDLLPIPYTKHKLELICQKIETVQLKIKRTIAIENITSYLQYANSEIPETVFITEMIKRTGCHLLLDLNNLHINSINFGFDAEKYLKQLPLDRVNQIHLAGYSEGEHFLIDSHDTPIYSEQLHLLKLFLIKNRPVPIMIERDANIPELDVLLDELKKVKKIYAS